MERSKSFIFRTLKNPRDTFTLNYVSYKLALNKIRTCSKFNKKALALDPNNGYFLDTLGWVEYKRNNYNSAVFLENLLFFQEC